MKKIKLIRKYPGSPKLGTELTPKVDKENYNTNNFYWEGSWFNPNDFCEFWEEIVDPDYESLSFINKEGDIICTLNDEGNYVANIEIECFYSRYTLNETLTLLVLSLLV